MVTLRQELEFLRCNQCCFSYGFLVTSHHKLANVICCSVEPKRPGVKRKMSEDEDTEAVR